MIGNNGSRYLSFLHTIIRFGWLYGVEQDNINGDEDEEGDRDQEPADNFKSLGPSHPPWRDQHEDQAVLEEGEEDDQEAGEHPDVDEGGMLPLTPLFKAKVLSSTKMFILLLRPIPLTGRVKWVR